MNQLARVPALTRAIEAIHAVADARFHYERQKRKAKLRERISLFALSEQALLDWFGDCSRRPIGFTFDSLDEAIAKLTGCARVEREYCRTRNWKRRPDLAAAQWDRLIVARALRRGARQLKREAA